MTSSLSVDYSNLPQKCSRTPTRLTNEFGYLLDRIVDRIIFIYTENADFEAAIKIQREYRTATIILSDYFFQLNDEQQRQAFVHELTHVHTEPIHEACEDVLKHFVAEGVHEYCAENLRKAHELTTDDLSRILLKLHDQNTKLKHRLDLLDTQGDLS